MLNAKSLQLFKQASSRVPAYIKFLDEKGIDPSKIKTIDDLEKLPISSKKEYLKKFKLEELLWDGDLSSAMIFCSTSGSTGEPFYFPRNELLSKQYAELISPFLTNHGTDQKNSTTLIINAFGMGVWIGGILTHTAVVDAITYLKYPASVLPVGYNKEEVIKALIRLSPIFDETILTGYPPFIKEVIDEAVKRKIDLKKLKLRFIFAAEAFTETFRDYLCNIAGSNPVKDTLSIYGSADIGAMARETPACIVIRRIASKNKKLFNDIFGQIEKTPTLAQFDSQNICFEAVDGEIVLTGNSALPLIRYAIGDHGGVLEFDQINKILMSNNIDIEEELRKNGIKGISKDPFVYVYERADFSTSLHGINIYPEFIKEALLDKQLSGYVTQKFTMVTQLNSSNDQVLELNIELRNDVQGSTKLTELIESIVEDKLAARSSEFAEVLRSKKGSNLLSVKLWPYEDKKYFSPGIKQKWVIPNK